MRLIDIKGAINFAYEHYNPQYNDNTCIIDNILNCKLALEKLYEVDLLEWRNDTINAFTKILEYSTDRMVSDSSRYDILKDTLEKMRFTIKFFYDWINRYYPYEEDETTIDIKLPELTRISDLKRATSLIEKSLTPVVSEIGGEVKIKHLEYGSSWIVIGLGIPIAVKLVTGIANAAINISKEFISLKNAYQQYERNKMRTDILRTLKETNELLLKNQTRLLAEEVELNNYPESNNERTERIRVSIHEMSKLMDLGGEIYPGLIESVPESKDLSSDYKMLKKLIDNIAVAELPRNEEKSEPEDDQEENV